MKLQLSVDYMVFGRVPAWRTQKRFLNTWYETTVEIAFILT